MIAPLKHETTYKYDEETTSKSRTTPKATKRPTPTTPTTSKQGQRAQRNTTEAGYDGAGQIISQTDGNKHTTKYERNVLEQVTEIIDPLSQKTLKEYDTAGNLTSVNDAEERMTSYKYNPDNRLTGASYSDGKPTA